MNRKHLAVLVLLSCLWMEAVIAQDAGWIDSIEGDGTSVRLVRQGRTESAHPYTQLHVGDQLHIASEKATVVLATADGKSLRIGARQSPFIIAASGAAPTVSGNVLKWVSGLFSDERKKTAPQSLSAMSTRGTQDGPLAVPYLSKRFLLVAEKRPLYFSWSGGQPPYRIRLLRQEDGREIFLLANLRERWVVAPTADLVPGDYLLEISDSSQTTYEDFLQLVPPGLAPRFPDPPALATLPPPVSDVVEASWLGTTENGLWVLEAMQRLHNLSASNATAKAVLERIEQGAAVR